MRLMWLKVTTIAIALAAAAGGCSAKHETHFLDDEVFHGKAPEAGKAQPAGRSEEAALYASMRRQLALLEAQGKIAANVEVYWPDETPAIGVTVEATDATFQKFSAAVQADGAAHMDLPSLNVKRWRVSDGTATAVVSGPQFAPDKSGMPVLRAVIFLPARPLSALLNEAPVLAPAPAPPSSGPGVIYPADIVTKDQRMAWLKMQGRLAHDRGDAAEEARFGAAYNELVLSGKVR